MEEMAAGKVHAEKVSAISGGNSEEICPNGTKATGKSGKVPVA